MRKESSGRGWAAALLLALLSLSGRAETVVLASPRLRVTVDVALGRVMGLSLDGGPNLLWSEPPEQLAKDRRNGNGFSWGGAFVYHAQEMTRFLHTGLPYGDDLSLLQQPWKVISSGPATLTIESATSPLLNVSLRRTISLDPSAPVVRFSDVLTRTGRNPFPVHVWTITQVPVPLYTLLDVAMPTGGDRSYLDLKPNLLRPGMVDDLGKRLRFRVPSETLAKIGTLGRWNAAVYPGYIFLQTTALDPDGCYLDGASIEAYSGAWTELETVSPALHLKPGESITHAVAWRLIPCADASAALQTLEPFLPRESP